MTLYNLYMNHVHRSYAMYEQGAALSLENREPYSDAYYETSSEPTDLVFEVDSRVSVGKNYMGEPVLIPPSEVIGYEIFEFEGLVAQGLAKIRKRRPSDSPVDFKT